MTEATQNLIRTLRIAVEAGTMSTPAAFMTLDSFVLIHEDKGIKEEAENALADALDE